MHPDYTRRLAATLTFIFATHLAFAADIDVGVDGCTLIDAIHAANNDTATGGCVAGNGPDTIHLPAASTHTLTTVNNALDGPTGLPAILTEVTIEGNGSTIRRDPSASTPRFRIFHVADGMLSLNDLTIRDGLVDARGAGLLIWPGATAVLTGSAVSQNRADADGGGIFNSGTCHLVDSSVGGNMTLLAGNGGGILNFGSLIVTGSIIESNISGAHGLPGALGGGGIFNDGISGEGMVVLSNSTLYDNRSSYDAGGIYNRDGTLTLNNVTMVLNQADIKGAGMLSAAGTVTLLQSLVAGNICFCSIDGREIYLGGTNLSSSVNLLGFSGYTTAQAFNFVTGSTDITATSDGTTPTALADIVDTVPQDHGGPTRTMALVNGSPAMDAITDGTCPPPATDQRGVTRPRDGDDDGTAACDIGAFESVNPSDTDGDGVAEADDLCPETVSGALVDGNGCADAQVDGDGDGVCDPGAPSGGPSACNGSDNCPLVANAGQDDADGDTVGDACDNCLLEPNPDQCNTNAPDADAADLGDDTFGNACDADLDNNGIVNSFDLTMLRANLGASGDNDADINCDGTVNSFDLTEMRQDFGQAPGPGAAAP